MNIAGVSCAPVIADITVPVSPMISPLTRCLPLCSASCPPCFSFILCTSACLRAAALSARAALATSRAVRGRSSRSITFICVLFPRSPYRTFAPWFRSGIPIIFSSVFQYPSPYDHRISLCASSSHPSCSSGTRHRLPVPRSVPRSKDRSAPSASIIAVLPRFFPRVSKRLRASFALGKYGAPAPSPSTNATRRRGRSSSNIFHLASGSRLLIAAAFPASSSS